MWFVVLLIAVALLLYVLSIIARMAALFAHLLIYPTLFFALVFFIIWLLKPRDGF
jgi:hypothetical protein